MITHQSSIHTIVSDMIKDKVEHEVYATLNIATVVSGITRRFLKARIEKLLKARLRLESTYIGT